MSTSTAPPGVAAAATAARFVPRKYQLIRTIRPIAASVMPQSAADISRLLHHLETGAIDRGFHHVRCHGIVEPQRRLADLDLERLDAWHRPEHARQAVDAPAARHAADDERLLDGHRNSFVSKIPLPPIWFQLLKTRCAARPRHASRRCLGLAPWQNRPCRTA